MTKYNTDEQAGGYEPEVIKHRDDAPEGCSWVTESVAMVGGGSNVQTVSANDSAKPAPEQTAPDAVIERMALAMQDVFPIVHGDTNKNGDWCVSKLALNTFRGAAKAAYAIAREDVRDVARKVGIAGNHLGSLLLDEHPPHTALDEQVLEFYGAGMSYDIWVAWKLCYEAYVALCAAPQSPEQGGE